jgi:two-component system, NtrC family, response regulator AtoC
MELNKTTSFNPAPSLIFSQKFGHQWDEALRAFITGDFSVAYRLFHNLLLIHPCDPCLNTACGHCHLHLGNPQKASDFYNKALEASSPPVEALYNFAKLLLKTGQRSEAEELFLRIERNFPRVKKGEFYLGILFDSSEEFYCDIALSIASINKDRGNRLEAEKWYNKALEKKENCIPALEAIAEYALLSKNYVKSINILQQILECSLLETDQVNAHNKLGVACYENGMLDDAVEHFSWVLKRSPSDPTAIHNLNYIYELEGIFEKKEKRERPIWLMDSRDGAKPIFQLGNNPEENTPESGPVIIGKSAGMLRVMRHARVAAASDKPVLIQGENGTGKELLARLISHNSNRIDGPFTVINCASIPELVLESELFGHEKGAFTGARARKPGALEISTKGTIFFDEISALTHRLQSVLLRAIREGSFTTMGSSRRVLVDVRFISATNRDLAAMIETGEFREDLYYALNVLPIEVPPLRERAQDIPLLIDFFVRKFGRHEKGVQVDLPKEDLDILMEHDWPGNIRELGNLIERALVMGRQSSLYMEELARLRKYRATRTRKIHEDTTTQQFPIEMSLADIEKKHIHSVLKYCDQNQRQAAKVLGINPSTLWRKLKSYE